MDLFHPLTAGWFTGKFGEPTEPQRLGWPSIVAGRHTLIAAPTGSGKTFAAFLASLDSLVRHGLAGTLEDRTEVVYVSPLKALSNDIRRNLEGPLAELGAAAIDAGLSLPPLRVVVRTGDTPSHQRAAMLRRPPHLLVTTPESLYLLLTSEKGRRMLANVKTVIIDEIHALARDKRGSHLSLSLERLEALCPTPPTRIGLSATQRPIDEIARFLVGAGRVDAEGKPDCDIIDVGHARDLDLGIEVPPSELAAVCSGECWGEIHARLTQLIASHRATIIFVNTRRMAERLAHSLRQILGEEAVAGHHGSMAKEIRHDVEDRLKKGELKAIVATASLEMGIDIGYVDLVCQISSPRAIATFLQRVGRSGHALGKTPKGRLFPLTRDDLIEAMALIRAVKAKRLDPIEIPVAPIDILAQQIIAAAALEEWKEDDLFALVRRAWPYRNLTRDEFEKTIAMLADPDMRRARGGARLSRDRINGVIKASRGSRLIAATCGGAIPDTADYRVVTAESGTFVGTVNEDFAIESMAGDIFLLGNNSWRIRQVTASEVLVDDAKGAPPSIPFWLGEGPGRTRELSGEVARLREDLAERIEPASGDDDFGPQPRAVEFLERECDAGQWPATQAAKYVAAQKIAHGLVPTQNRIVFERFFDETGGMQLVLHAPFGARINRAWGLAMRKRFCRSFDFELQAAADDNGVVLSLGPQHSFPLEDMFELLRSKSARHFLEQAILAAPMFKVRWRWNVTRALTVLRQRGGKRVPPALLRFRCDDQLTAVFPAQTACLENRPEDLDIPDHPLVQQTMLDCLTEATDCRHWVEVLAGREAGQIEFIGRDTLEPSPFSHELLNANPYAFLDDAPLEERRARAVATRRTLSPKDLSDLARLDPEAIRQVRQEAWPTVRDPGELHDALLWLVALPAAEGDAWLREFTALVDSGRATVIERVGKPSLWASAENLPTLRAIWPDAQTRPPVTLPPSLDIAVEQTDAIKRIVRGRLDVVGPVTEERLATDLGLEREQVAAALVAIETEGSVLRGDFSPPEEKPAGAVEWCDRRLLARIHRLTLDEARRRIEPVSPADFWRYLLLHQKVEAPSTLEGPEGVLAAVALLQGFESPAGAWEHDLLAARVADYEPDWLDDLTLTGEVGWGRLEPRANQEKPVRGSPMSRVVPISLFRRIDLAWLVPASRANGETPTIRGDAGAVLDALRDRGALFVHDILAITGLLPSQVEEALLELSAHGLIHADGFAGIRAIVAPDKRKPSRRRRPGRAPKRSAAGGGRWSLFPGHVPAMPAAERAEKWAGQLLARYGVMFRDLLTRESNAPAWWELVAVYRRREARGEIRGGRFVSDVAGEQFALPGVIEELRKVRDQSEKESVGVVISAADPLNLAGVLTGGPKVAAVRGNALYLEQGQLVATLEAGEVRFHRPVPPARVDDIRRRLGRTAAVRTHETTVERDRRRLTSSLFPDV